MLQVNPLTAAIGSFLLTQVAIVASATGPLDIVGSGTWNSLAERAPYLLIFLFGLITFFWFLRDHINASAKRELERDEDLFRKFESMESRCNERIKAMQDSFLVTLKEVTHDHREIEERSLRISETMISAQQNFLFSEAEKSKVIQEVRDYLRDITKR